MRKAILIFAALLMVASGVAAVSAYEAHIINVTAHVENALYVDSSAAEFGVMFPEEWNKIKKEVRLSDSAQDELGEASGNLSEVQYKIFAEWKVDTDNGTPANHIPDVMIDGIDHYAWIGEWLWVAQNAQQNQTCPMLDASEWTNVGPAPVGDDYAKLVGGPYSLTDDAVSYVDILFLAPCFAGYYNAETDNKPDWWPLDTWPRIAADDARHLENGVDLGLDLKIQVTNIIRN